MDFQLGQLYYGVMLALALNRTLILPKVFGFKLCCFSPLFQARVRACLLVESQLNRGCQLQNRAAAVMSRRLQLCAGRTLRETKTTE